MSLVQFKRNADNNNIHLKFDDGFEADVSLQELRDNCPCWSCKGEELLLHKYEPPGKTPLTESGYRLEKVLPAGNYAVQLFWQDGHDTGIYSWDYFKKISQKN